MQTRITDALRGTRFHRALIDLYRMTGSQFQPGVDTAVYLEDTYARIARRSWVQRLCRCTSCPLEVFLIRKAAKRRYRAKTQGQSSPQVPPQQLWSIALIIPPG